MDEALVFVFEAKKEVGLFVAEGVRIFLHCHVSLRFLHMRLKSSMKSRSSGIEGGQRLAQVLWVCKTRVLPLRWPAPGSCCLRGPAVWRTHGNGSCTN